MMDTLRVPCDTTVPLTVPSRGQSESREVQKAPPCLLCNEVQDVCCHNTQRSIRELSDVITSAIFIEDNHPVSSAHYMGTEKVTGDGGFTRMDNMYALPVYIFLRDGSTEPTGNKLTERKCQSETKEANGKKGIKDVIEEEEFEEARRDMEAYIKQVEGEGEE
ncbi:hypothetical protein KUCAC02_005882 [Chaenocephalus aceratus]|uniref:Uncharacterized protein n=1 Tax=Chaenocephalus aceratus TaxID=36190 RepID=A0ACB9WPR1_CHAAC|nr:hypothetical protein KUCAC02_005882 [Chaenocephalus aceratus]